MKLFIIVSRFPYPLEKGDKLRAWHQIQLLAEKHEVYLFCLSDAPIPSAHIDFVKSQVAHLEVAYLSKARLLLNLMRGLFNLRPFQVNYFYSGKIHKRVREVLREFQPNAIYCQLIRCAEYVKNEHDFSKTIDYMDALSAGVRRRSDLKKGIVKLAFREEAKRLALYENLVFDYFENHTIISEQDRDLIYHEKRRSIKVNRNGVDSDYFFPQRKEKVYDLVFTGNMNYPPNVDGAKRIVYEILPDLKERGFALKVLIAGANPSDEVKELAKVEGVTVSGWMDDIRVAYDSARVFVAPMRIGTGLQNKLLEAMSMELPSITTHLAANAFSKEQQKAFVTADTNHLIVEAILYFINFRENAAQQGKLARDMVVAHFSWNAAVSELEDILFNAYQKK